MLGQEDAQLGRILLVQESFGAVLVDFLFFLSHVEQEYLLQIK